MPRSYNGKNNGALLDIALVARDVHLILVILELYFYGKDFP